MKIGGEGYGTCECAHTNDHGYTIYDWKPQLHTIYLAIGRGQGFIPCQWRACKYTSRLGW